MSLVGTRPPTVDEWDKYELHHRARLATKPGLTGMWQVSGRSNITDFEEVVKLDKQYISEWTMGLDIKILFKSIVTNVLTALYQPFWFAILLTIFILFFYMYAYHPTDAGKGIKTACIAWVRTFKNSLYFRKLFCLVFFTVMILFRTLLNRNMWMNPLSDVMGGWWIWEKRSDGTVTLTTECFENIALMLPFTFLLMWTAKEKLLKGKGRQICFTSILWYSTKVAFLFSLTIEFLQLFLRLGTFQLSDLCYNTLGGAIGGVLYWMGWKVKKQ